MLKYNERLNAMKKVAFDSGYSPERLRAWILANNIPLKDKKEQQDIHNKKPYVEQVDAPSEADPGYSPERLKAYLIAQGYIKPENMKKVAFDFSGLTQKVLANIKEHPELYGAAATARSKYPPIAPGN